MLVFSDIPKDRTVEDLEEAAASFNAAATECDKIAETLHFSNMGDKKVCEQLVVNYFQQIESDPLRTGAIVIGTRDILKQ